MKKPVILKRQLGVKPSTIDMVAAQVAAASSAETAEYELRRVALSHINIWSEQPRQMFITMEDIYLGVIDFSDIHHENKVLELEGIIGLAFSLKEFGMLNPPLAHALPGRDVQLLGGQRRVMAAIFAALHIETSVEEGRAKHEVKISSSPDMSILENEKVEVKVYKKRPSDDDIEKIGIVDNAQRTNLPPSDVLRWLLAYADRKQAREEVITHNDIITILGVGRSMAFGYVKLIKHSNLPWVKEACGMVCSGKGSINDIFQIIEASASQREALYNKLFGVNPPIIKRTKISLGSSSNLPAIRNLIMANASMELKEQFDKVNWSNPRDVRKAFNDFLKSWENTHG